MSFRNDDELRDTIERQFPDHADGMILMDGHSRACVGVWYDDEHETWRLVYDRHAIIRTLITRDGMTHESAVEFFDFNISGGLPPDGPLIIDLFLP